MAQRYDAMLANKGLLSSLSLWPFWILASFGFFVTLLLASELPKLFSRMPTPGTITSSARSPQEESFWLSHASTIEPALLLLVVIFMIFSCYWLAFSNRIYFVTEIGRDLLAKAPNAVTEEQSPTRRESS